MNIFQNLIDTPENVELPSDTSDTEEDERILTLSDQETAEKIRKLQIANEKELNNLVIRKMAQAMIEDIGHSIQTNFVDFARRESPNIAALLEAPEKERDIEKMLSEKIQISIEAVKSECEKLASDRMFE